MKSLTLIAYLLPMSCWFFLYGALTEISLAVGGCILAIVMIRSMQIQSQLLKESLEMAEKLKIAKAEAESLARTDPLTGLSNRRAFLEIGTALLSQSHRQGIHVSAIMIDIDYFKKINDSYGHAGGDAILQNLSTLLAGFLRNSDISCRLGGEEFAVLLPGSNLENAVLIAENIRLLIENSPTLFKGSRVEITVSLGVACGPKDMEEILRVADMALYRAKEYGRNRVVG